MTETTPPDDTAQFEDWVTIWQSELAACAVDRELHEATQRMIDLGALQMRAALAPLAARLDAAGLAGAPSPAWTTAAPATSDERLRTLESRIAELERRLPP